MAAMKIRARKSLRVWRGQQEPPLTQDECGAILGKTGALIRMFETGKATLVDEDCVRLSLKTGINLHDFLTRKRIRHIQEAARLLESELTFV